MKQCPTKFRPLVADLLDGKITPAGKELLLKELRRNPKFADELAEIYGDHLVMRIQSGPDRTNEVMKEVYSVTRWAGETRETIRKFEETEEGLPRVIEETVSITRWVGQSAQFIRNVEDAILPRQIAQENRRSWRRVLYGSAAACFAILCLFAVIRSSTPENSYLPEVELQKDGTATLTRWGFTYAVTDKLSVQAGDTFNTGASGGLSLLFAQNVTVELARNSEIKLPEAASHAAPYLVRGAATIKVPPQAIDAPPFKIDTSDARVTIRSTELILAVRSSGTLVRVSNGKVHVASSDLSNSRSATVDAGSEIVTQGPNAFVVRKTLSIDDDWLLALDPVLWLDAAHWETLDLDKRKRISAWHDRSKTKTVFMAPSEDSRPRMLPDELNALDTVYFASPQQILTSIRSIKLATVFIVCRYQGVIPSHGGLFGTLGDFGIRHTGKRFWYGQPQVDGNVADFGNPNLATTWVNGDPNGDASSGIPQLVTVVRQESAEFEEPTLGSYFRHPGYGIGSRPFHGIICEVIAFDRPIDDLLRQQIEAHLVKKWGLLTQTLR